MKKASFLVLLVALFVISYAHEYILIAENFKVKKGDTLNVHLFVADGFNIEMERPLQASITKNYSLETSNGTIDLLQEGKTGSLPILQNLLILKDWG